MITIRKQDIVRKPSAAGRETLYAEATSPGGNMVRWDFLEVPVGSEITDGHAMFASRHLTSEELRADEEA